LQTSECNYQSASKLTLPIVGAFTADAKHGDSGALVKIPFFVSDIPDLIILGRAAIKALRIYLVWTSFFTPVRPWEKLTVL